MERKEAIEVVKKNYPHVNVSGSQFETALRTLIPELKESEGERIRKGLIEACKQSLIVGGFHKDKVIAWLEKQGEQKPNTVLDIEIPFGTKDSELQEASYHIPEGFRAEIKGNKVVIKKGEQKSFARYKVGDTIYYDSFGRLVSFVIANIVEDGTDNPMYEDKDGNSVFQNDIVGQKPADKVEQKFHKGDWVVNNNGEPQFSQVTARSWPDSKIKGVEDNLESFINTATLDKQYHLWTIQDAKDGDVLEFGDHGRLVVGIVSYVNKTTGKVDVNCLLENNNFKVGNYYNLDTINPHPATKGQCDLLFQKMHEAGYDWDAEKKELKKIEQNPAWSEEDEKFFKTALWHISYSISNGKSTDCHCDTTEWFKSLKERYTWKPSDEQMAALADALSLAKNCGEEYAFDLRTLYEQLKKLREE